MSYCIIGVMGHVEDSKGNFRGVKGAGKDTLVDAWIAQYGKDYETLKLPLAAYTKQVLQSRYALKDMDMDHKGKDQMLGLSDNPEASFRDLCIQLATSVVREELKCDEFWLHYVNKRIRAFIQSFEEELEEYSGAPSDSSDDRRRLAREEIVKVLKKHMPNWSETGKKKIIFIPDIRFQNEYDYFKRKYGQHCHMVQVKRIVEQVSPQASDQHISNQSHPNMKPECILSNDGTPDELAYSLQEKVILGVINIE